MQRDDHIPQAPGALPVLGHLIPMLRDPLAFFRSLPARADLVRIRLGPVSAVVVCDAALTRRILRDDRTFDKGGPFFERAREFGGNGLATCPYATHRPQRRMCQPAFRPERLAAYTAVMTTQAEAVIATWRDGQIIDVVAEMTDVTSRSLVSTGFSDAFPPEDLKHLLDDLDIIIKGIYRRMIQPAALNRLPTPGNRRHRQAITHLRGALAQVIADRRAQATDHGDLLSALLAAQDPEAGGTGLTDAEIIDNASTFFIAGMESTAATLSWALHLLTRRPDIMGRLHAEVDTVLGGRAPGHEDIPRLPLTNRVITETLRLYPPTWIFTRVATSDTALGRDPIPAGTVIVYSPYLLHHHPDLYPDPERFDPDRWLSVDAKYTLRNAFFPFGGGARKCIGDQFAINETVVTLAAIARHWRLHPMPGHQARATPAATLRPRGLRLRVQARGSLGR